MKKIDGVVFTGGIGANSYVVRKKIIEHLAGLPKLNVYAIHTDEAQMIAKKVRAVI